MRLVEEQHLVKMSSKGAYQGIKLIDELSEGTWRAINDKDVKLERAGNCDSMKFKGGDRQMGKGRKRE